MPDLPPVETIFILEPYSEVRIEIIDESLTPFRKPPEDSETTQDSPPEQTYGFAFPVSGMTTGSTQAIIAVTADAPDSQIDLTTIDQSILYPYSPEALPLNTEAKDYPKFTQKIKGSQIAKIHVKRHDRR